jgi:hypothetical protein
MFNSQQSKYRRMKLKKNQQKKNKTQAKSSKSAKPHKLDNVNGIT